MPKILSHFVSVIFLSVLFSIESQSSIGRPMECSIVMSPLFLLHAHLESEQSRQDKIIAVGNSFRIGKSHQLHYLDQGEIQDSISSKVADLNQRARRIELDIHSSYFFIDQRMVAFETPLVTKEQWGIFLGQYFADFRFQFLDSFLSLISVPVDLIKRVSIDFKDVKVEDVSNSVAGFIPKIVGKNRTRTQKISTSEATVELSDLFNELGPGSVKLFRLQFNYNYSSNYWHSFASYGESRIKGTTYVAINPFTGRMINISILEY